MWARIAAMTARDWIERDAAVVWHGFTQMSTFAESDPVIVERSEGHELIDVDGRHYLDAISSLWVTTLGHHVPELDDAIVRQLARGAPRFAQCWNAIFSACSTADAPSDA